MATAPKKTASASTRPMPAKSKTAATPAKGKTAAMPTTARARTGTAMKPGASSKLPPAKSKGK